MPHTRLLASSTILMALPILALAEPADADWSSRALAEIAAREYELTWQEETALSDLG